jgi:hypothetical protein
MAKKNIYSMSDLVCINGYDIHESLLLFQFGPMTRKSAEKIMLTESIFQTFLTATDNKLSKVLIEDETE